MSAPRPVARTITVRLTAGQYEATMHALTRAEDEWEADCEDGAGDAGKRQTLRKLREARPLLAAAWKAGRR